MIQRVVRCMVVSFVTCSAAFAQNPASVPSGPAAEVQRSYAAVKENILKSADKMPAADFGYKPAADVRTYARVLNHISEAQLRSCGAVNRTVSDAQPKVPAETADRDAIITALKASFAECDKAFSSLTNEICRMSSRFRRDSARVWVWSGERSRTTWSSMQLSRCICG